MKLGVSTNLLSRIFLTLLAVSSFPKSVYANSPHAHLQRNIVIFVADGLRSGSVNPTDAPTMYALRQNGVYFGNSHSSFPTMTTVNAAVVATGRDPGSTGDFGNALYAGYPLFNTRPSEHKAGTLTPYLENNRVLADLNEHFGGNYLHGETLLSLAREHGYLTAIVGKTGPVAIQDIAELRLSKENQLQQTATYILDDSTGTAKEVSLNEQLLDALQRSGVGLMAPPRVQPSGNNSTPGTKSANLPQQQYFADAMTKAILPSFRAQDKPFVVLFWSRDPDGSQHFQGDSLNTLQPGVNGPTSRAGVSNADRNLKQILDYINRDSVLAANTDVFVLADHGVATLSKKEVDRAGVKTSSYSAQFTYKDETGRQEVNAGFVPNGFLAIDLAHFLHRNLYDPDGLLTGADGKQVYIPVDPAIPQETAIKRQHSTNGNGIIGGSGTLLEAPDAEVIVAANGGSDLIYIPNSDRELALKIADFLSRQDYVGGLFAADSYGDVPGALPLSVIGLKGSSVLPVPSFVVNFKTFAIDPANRLMTAVQIADSDLQEGQGSHGALSRDNTLNFMAASGPDFKSGYVDNAPAGNRDVAVTLAHILGLPLRDTDGRVLTEALQKGGNPPAETQTLVAKSSPTKRGVATVLLYQRLGNNSYYDDACFVSSEWKNRENPCAQ